MKSLIPYSGEKEIIEKQLGDLFQDVQRKHLLDAIMHLTNYTLYANITRHLRHPSEVKTILEKLIQCYRDVYIE